MSATHDHDHTPIQDADQISEFDVLETAVRELAIEKGLFSAEDHRRFLEWAQNIGPHGGSRLVAKAWVDPEFKRRLLGNALEAAQELGLDAGPSPQVVAVENTRDVHHIVVCTLCSCYPKALLGPPPDWYKSLPYRSRAVSEPREVLAEFGLELDPDVELRVLDSTADIRYLVVPRRPDGTEHMKIGRAHV